MEALSEKFMKLVGELFARSKTTASGSVQVLTALPLSSNITLGDAIGQDGKIGAKQQFSVAHANRDYLPDHIIAMLVENAIK
ncbi:hypothetical protein HDE_05820 [Halotydeus destructor]|nr:hypothetical protein HDE_05820 [Halotydeus destructor]